MQVTLSLSLQKISGLSLAGGVMGIKVGFGAANGLEES